MKILFIGVGLSHYYNQVLNRLDKEPDIEIVDLVVSSDAGYKREAIYQTRQGVAFTVVALKEIIFNALSNNRFKGFRGLARLLEDLRPDVIVTTEVYVRMFMYDAPTISVVRKHDIKIILKDIPFRLDPYPIAKEKITSGARDQEYTPFLIGFSLRALRKVKMGKIAELIEKCISHSSSMRRLRRTVGRKFLLEKLEESKRVYNFVDAHVNYVEKAFEIFGSYGVPRKKIFITYNSPDTDILFDIRKKIESEAPILPHNNHRLIHVGRLIPWKRVDMLIEAHSKAKTVFPDTELLIIGYGPEEARLRALVRELKLEDSVKFIGGVYDPAILGKYLMASSIYVLAGMGGISLNDAMAFGRPIICSICDGTEVKLVRDGYNGVYFNDGSLEDLTDKILYIFNNPEMMKKMGEHSTSAIKNEINIYSVIDGYRKAFESVLSTRNP